MKKTLFTIACALVMFSLLGGRANASLIVPSLVSGTGTYNNSTGLIIDDIIPPEGTFWKSGTVWWTGIIPTFTIDLGQAYTVQDIIISIDNNDFYKVDYSIDNSSWTNLFTINSSYGEIGWGMDTMATDSGHGEYVSGIDFTAVNAQYLKVYATGGDGMYSIGEVQAYGVSAVPEPATIALLGIGLAGLGGGYLRRRRKRR